MTAGGHFLSWSAEFAFLALGGLATYVMEGSDFSDTLLELLAFTYPRVNLVVVPIVHLMS